MRFSLARVFAVSTVATATVSVVAFGAFLRSSRASILAASVQRRDDVATRVNERVVRELSRATEALEDVERGIRTGAIPSGDDRAIEAHLYVHLASAPALEEVTLTRATLDGWDDKGEARIARDGRSQLSVRRTTPGTIGVRIVRVSDSKATAMGRELLEGAPFGSSTFGPPWPAEDPTAHRTFSVLVSRDRLGRTLWSDLHPSDLDGVSTPGERRAVLTVQKAIDDAAGRPLGVLRVGIRTSELDAVVARATKDADPRIPHRIVLASVDDVGGGKHEVRLVARVSPDDPLELMGNDLRLTPKRPPPELAAFLASDVARSLAEDHPNGGGTIEANGERYLVTAREVALGRGGTRGWFTAVIVPEDAYVADLVGFERVFGAIFLAAMAIVVAIGVSVTAVLRRGLARAAESTARMRAFDFGASTTTSALAEVDDVLSGLERAKTAARTMTKYVPLDLVRRLYDANEEAALGGHPAELTLMFSDIEGFTTLAEKLPPDELAARLGDYLEAMTNAVTGTGGVVDKFIGDAVMAFWNAPAPVPDHPAHACRTVLDCFAATRALFASEKWSGLPALKTRYGVHTARVMVGHFGAPTRLSYTALGDGVNLAARLEPLCKQYDLLVLVSEDVVRAVGDAFVFRRVDRVAVKGKSRAIEVHELLGANGDELPDLSRARAYEAAFEAYLGRDFAGALDVLAPLEKTDGPSRVLAARCRDYLATPPPAEWDGVFVARSK